VHEWLLLCFVQEIDLNLLPVLRVLLEEEHVSRAAERLHLSIPATSRALDRCRRTFNDPLLVRQGRGVVATPRARELLVQLVSLLEGLEVLRVPTPVFDPKLVRQTFVVRANEAVIAALGSSLFVGLHGEAPHVEVRFESEAADDLERVADGSASLAIGSYTAVARELVAESLVAEQMIVAMRADHPAAKQMLTLKRFVALDHVVASRRGRARGPVDRYLSEFGFERRVVAVVPTFSAALAIALSSDAIALVPKRLAVLLSGDGGAALRKPPLGLPDIDVQQIWHGRLTNDPAHSWFRDRVRAAAVAAKAKDQPLRRK
jgi:DNA-binding transcriptional LysR family regulator